EHLPGDDATHDAAGDAERTVEDLRGRAALLLSRHGVTPSPAGGWSRRWTLPGRRTGRGSGEARAHGRCPSPACAAACARHGYRAGAAAATPRRAARPGARAPARAHSPAPPGTGGQGG